MMPHEHTKLPSRDDVTGDPSAHPPSASVVTTVYNRAPILQRAMRSVLDQSFSDFEYIVVDDGSTDGSANVAAAIDDPRIRLIRCPHRGRAAALNTAFAACKGEFILIQDSDDIALPGRFEKQIGFLRAHPDIGMVGCQLRVLHTASNKQRIYNLPTNHEDIGTLMLVTSAVPFCASAIRREILPSQSPFDESMPAAEDYAFQLTILLRTRFANLQEVLQYKIDMIDSLGQVQEKAQSDLTLAVSRRFIEEQSMNTTIFANPTDAIFSRARLEYYNGDARLARSILFGMLRRNPFNAFAWRFFLPSLLGPSFLRSLRANAPLRALTAFAKRSHLLRRYFLPMF